MGDSDSISSTMGSGGYGDSDSESYYNTPAQSFDSRMGYDTGGSSSSSNTPYMDFTQAEQALSPTGVYGQEALQTNPYMDASYGNYTTPQVDYSNLDWLSANWDKYGKKLGQFGLGMLAKTNPMAATAYSLYNLYNSPRGSVAGSVGGGLGSAVAGAINPVLAGLGGVAGASTAQRAAANAENTYGMDTSQRASSSRPVDYGAVGARLGSMWNNYGESKALGSQASNLQGLFSQNSPYSQQLRQSLMRKDAQAGRRSQAGSREVELQARLAELASRQAPQLQNLTQARTDARSRMLGDIFSAGRGLNDIFS